MDHSFGMCEVECTGHSIDKLNDFVERPLTALDDDLTQVATIDVFENGVGHVCPGSKIVDRCDALVAEQCSDASFPGRIGRCRGTSRAGQLDFQRHVAIQRAVVGEEHLSHAAASEFGTEQVSVGNELADAEVFDFMRRTVRFTYAALATVRGDFAVGERVAPAFFIHHIIPPVRP